VWSENPLAIALAAAADILATACPPDFATWAGAPDTQRNIESSHLVLLDELASASAHNDAGTWRDRVASLEARWFAPLLDELRGGRMARLILVAPVEGSCCWRFELTRTDLLKFWRSAKPWSEYA
jgi:hypothetical protein